MIILMSNLTSDSHPLAIQYQTPMATDLPQETEFQPISHNLDTRMLYKQDFETLLYKQDCETLLYKQDCETLLYKQGFETLLFKQDLRHCYISKIWDIVI